MVAHRVCTQCSGWVRPRVFRRRTFSSRAPLFTHNGALPSDRWNLVSVLYCCVCVPVDADGRMWSRTVCAHSAHHGSVGGCSAPSRSHGGGLSSCTRPMFRGCNIHMDLYGTAGYVCWFTRLVIWRDPQSLRQCTRWVFMVVSVGVDGIQM